MAEVQQQEPTAEAIKQRKKREKEAAKNAALGVERFHIEVAGVFKPDLKRVMKAHGINNQQDIHQRLLINLIRVGVKTQAKVHRYVTTPFVVSENGSRLICTAGIKSLTMNSGEPEEEIFERTRLMLLSSN